MSRTDKICVTGATKGPFLNPTSVWQKLHSSQVCGQELTLEGVDYHFSSHSALSFRGIKFQASISKKWEVPFLLNPKSYGRGSVLVLRSREIWDTDFLFLNLLIDWRIHPGRGKPRIPETTTFPSTPVYKADASLQEMGATVLAPAPDQ